MLYQTEICLLLFVIFRAYTHIINLELKIVFWKTLSVLLSSFLLFMSYNFQ